MTNQPKDRVFAGSSDAVYAEYSARSDDAFTIAEAQDYEVYAVRGFQTKAALLNALKEYRAAGIAIDLLF